MISAARTVTLLVAGLLFSPSGARAGKGPKARPVGDDRLVSALLERAKLAASSRNRGGFLTCLTMASRTLFERVFSDGSWEPASLAGRSGLRLIELRRHEARPWAMAVVPAKDGVDREALFVRKEDGQWRLDEQHSLLVWQTVQQIKHGSKRQQRSVEAPTLMAKQVRSSLLPEGWSAEDPSSENDWRFLPRVEEAFVQKLRGPQDKRVSATFLLFTEEDEADWELWRRQMELALKSELAERQPSVGEAAALGRHSNTSYELLVRKGRSLLILYGDSEDVVGLGTRMAEQL